MIPGMGSFEQGGWKIPILGRGTGPQYTVCCTYSWCINHGYPWKCFCSSLEVGHRIFLFISLLLLLLSIFLYLNHFCSYLKDNNKEQNKVVSQDAQWSGWNKEKWFIKRCGKTLTSSFCLYSMMSLNFWRFLIYHYHYHCNQ